MMVYILEINLGYCEYTGIHVSVMHCVCTIKYCNNETSDKRALCCSVDCQSPVVLKDGFTSSALEVRVNKRGD